MSGNGSLLADEPSEEDYERADAFVDRSLSRDDASAERKALLLEFRRVIARTFRLNARWLSGRAGLTFAGTRIRNRPTIAELRISVMACSR